MRFWRPVVCQVPPAPTPKALRKPSPASSPDGTHIRARVPVRLSVRPLAQVYNNGRFEMRPGLSRQGDAYRFERPNGAIYSYRLENASAPPPAPDNARRQRLMTSAAQALARSRRAAVGGDFAPPPGPAKEAIRVTLFGEIVAAKGFTYDDLYVEWSLKCV